MHSRKRIFSKPITYRCVLDSSLIIMAPINGFMIHVMAYQLNYKQQRYGKTKLYM